MASVYNRNKILYISWYDPIKGKKFNKSTKLLDTPANRQNAKLIAEKLQKKLSEEKAKLIGIKIKRVDLDYAFEHFLRNNSNKHPKTITDYNRFYKKFTEKFSGSTLCSAITKLAVEEWLILIKMLPYAPNTIHGYYKQLNHFLNFLFEYGYTPMFKINKDIKPRKEITEKIIFSKEDICLIFNKLNDPEIKRNSSFVTLTYLAFYTGLRSSDLLNISVEKIDLDKQELRYYSPKRKIHRSIAFHHDLIPILEQRIKEVKTGKLLNYSETEAIGRAFRRFYKRIGLDNKGYVARTFRKTFITLCSTFNMNASIVAELVGHEHQTTADRFYNRINHKQMLRELKKFKSPIS